MAGERFEGVRVPDPGFAGDTGAVPADVGAALASYADDPGTYAAALATLRTARLLVPVVALLGEVAIDEAGLAHDKSSDMAAVLLTGADGRTALLGFTGTEPLHRWRDDARPVPVHRPGRRPGRAAGGRGGPGRRRGRSGAVRGAGGGPGGTGGGLADRARGDATGWVRPAP